MPKTITLTAAPLDSDATIRFLLNPERQGGAAARLDALVVVKVLRDDGGEPIRRGVQLPLNPTAIPTLTGAEVAQLRTLLVKVRNNAIAALGLD